MPSLRTVLNVVLSLLVLTVQADAQEWEKFGFRKLGFGFDLPPGFALNETSEDGRSATFKAGEGAFLTVWGDNLPRRHFKATIQAQLNADEVEGWEITYRRMTNTWASYSGIRDGRIRYVRAILVCKDRLGIFQLDYDAENKIPYDPIVTRMVRSLKADGC